MQACGFDQCGLEATELQKSFMASCTGGWQPEVVKVKNTSMFAVASEGMLCS